MNPFKLLDISPRSKILVLINCPDNSPDDIYCILGTGEVHERVFWIQGPEAILLIDFYKLLVAFDKGPISPY